MCRVFGCVASEPVSIRHELLAAENPLIRQSEDHDSGWGMAVYERPEGAEPLVVRFPEAAHADGDFVKATELQGQIFNVHVRRATMGELCLQNTHPFSPGSYTFGHNGTVLRYPRLLQPDRRRPEGNTDSEHGLNLLFSDGERLFAYRLGLFELHWLARPGQLLVASEQVTDEPGWHSVQQDVLLTLDPNDLEEPHAERLLGDELMQKAEVQKVDLTPHLRGEERGLAAAERAKAAAAAG